MSKTLIDYDADVKRIARWLFNVRGNQIKDKASFDLVFNAEIPSPSEGKKGLYERIRDATRNQYKKFDSSVDSKLFKEAGGKDLAKDRGRRANTVVRSRDRFLQEGASEVDLEGLDTPPAQKRRFGGRIRNQMVSVTAFTVKKKGKNVTVYRDKRGRFAKRIG